MKYVPICLLIFLMTFQLSAQEAVHEDLNKIIRQHGMEKSQVMDIASWLCDIYGPRLTGSPMLDKATEWGVKTLKDWGMENVHTEEWGPFGRGWELTHFEMHALSPNYFPIIAYPKAWSPSTNGPIKGEVVYMEVEEEADFEKYRGKLKGKFVMIDTIRVVEEKFEAHASRYDATSLLKMANAPMPTPRS